MADSGIWLEGNWRAGWALDYNPGRVRAVYVLVLTKTTWRR